MERTGEERVSTGKPTEDGPGNFIEDLVLDDLAQNKHGGRLMTRFPPEPNGYLHIGHAKSICLNFGIAGLAPSGVCNLRFDDTNPVTEDTEYVGSIKEDVRWLGFDWAAREYYASDYFEKLYGFAERLVNEGKAYVDSQTEEQIREGRGNFYKPGVESPFRSRAVAENIDLLRRMRAGEFADGAHVLRAKIDMQSTDLKLRDPLMYRIRKAHHHRTGDAWCIYPMYDFAHGLSDAIEGVTHSICTLEFQNHRPLYDWFVNAIGFESPPRQIEFARLNLTYTVLSKRWLQHLVKEKLVGGWDDPRMPTLAGMRRRGFPPEALRAFAERIGVARNDQIVDVALLEHAVRANLDASTPRLMAVLKPLKVTIENMGADEAHTFDAPLHPTDASFGTRPVTLRRELFIDQDDFMEDPPKQFFRLRPGGEVRLRYACILKCERVIKDAGGAIAELVCSWDPASRGGNPADGRKIKGTIHWVSAADARTAEVRLYDRLFTKENPMDVAEGGHFTDSMNRDSLEVLREVKVEPHLAALPAGARVQFERIGYFVADSVDHRSAHPVWNRTIGLKDSWAKVAGSHAGKA
jgi:glutaminyl-tRNA synthetase